MESSLILTDKILFYSTFHLLLCIPWDSREFELRIQDLGLLGLTAVTFLDNDWLLNGNSQDLGGVILRFSFFFLGDHLWMSFYLYGLDRLGCQWVSIAKVSILFTLISITSEVGFSSALHSPQDVGWQSSNYPRCCSSLQQSPHDQK